MRQYTKGMRKRRWKEMRNGMGKEVGDCEYPGGSGEVVGRPGLIKMVEEMDGMRDVKSIKRMRKLEKKENYSIGLFVCLFV